MVRPLEYSTPTHHHSTYKHEVDIVAKLVVIKSLLDGIVSSAHDDDSKLMAASAQELCGELISEIK